MVPTLLRTTALLGVFLAASTASEAPCVFETARLFNETGHAVTCADLGGLSVALYFAGEWCPLCRRFTPALRAFHARWNSSVQIVFISSDSSAEDAREHYAHQMGGWLALAWDDPVAAKLKRQHRVWSGREVGTFGYHRRSGVPAVVVVDPSGAEVAFLPGERWGAAACVADRVSSRRMPLLYTRSALTLRRTCPRLSRRTSQFARMGSG